MSARAALSVAVTQRSPVCRLQPNGRPAPGTGLARRIALDVARGLAFLHDRKVVHFDLVSSRLALCTLIWLEAFCLLYYLLPVAPATGGTPQQVGLADVMHTHFNHRYLYV